MVSKNFLDIVNQFVGPLIGGVIGYGFHWLQMYGKLKLHDYALVAKYVQYKGTNPMIVSMYVHLNFINTSGNTHIITDLSIRYYDRGKEYTPLFKDHFLYPSIVIEGKKSVLQKFEIDLERTFEYDAERFADAKIDDCFAIITYKQRRKIKTIKISYLAIGMMKDDTQPFSRYQL